MKNHEYGHLTYICKALYVRGVEHIKKIFIYNLETSGVEPIVTRYKFLLVCAPDNDKEKTWRVFG